MKTERIIMRALAWMIIVMLVIPPGIQAQDLAETDQTDRFKKEELVQMLAPIALYTDSLIAQILMASTYPLEIVEAERWVRQNEDLKGDALDDALQEKTWDPSVKSLCHFPGILFALSDKLDQTTKLGNAFLNQEDDVMATIQELRRKAHEQGNLATTKEQNVIIEKEVIRIEPADPSIIYVPVYNPLYVYGSWWYPAYPPYYWYYPPGVVISGGYIGFNFGFFVGIGISSWTWFDWHRHRIHVDLERTRRFHRFDHTRHKVDRPFWRHDPIHRRGVAYRDRKTSVRFKHRPSQRVIVGPEMRGYPLKSPKRKDVKPSPPPHKPRKEAVAPKVKTKREKIRITPKRDTPFRGIGDGKFERRASERGGQSRRMDDVKRKGKETDYPDRQGQESGRSPDIRKGRGFRR
ncbi:MAG: DUF3300 domain-containing protein [Desulfobacterales bacterium]|nr:DUF3300 domain-containing protein [Desulfobacterales bacterium]